MRYDQHPYFEFSFLEKFEINPKQVKKFSEKNYNNFILLCKDANNSLSMTQDINTEWIFRTYTATKMIMAATLLLNNADYCIRKNVMLPVPYLLYYAAFSSARGFIYASPFMQINDLDKLIESSHSKVLNIASDLIKNHIDRKIGNKIELFLKYLKNQRELFSYKFPASGICDDIKFDETENVCGLLAELTELSSYKIQEVYEKKFINNSTHKTQNEYEWMCLNQDVIQKLYKYDKIYLNGEEFGWPDNEDFYRINYIERKIKHPTSVFFTMTEGMTEDFFGSWCKLEDNDDNFNPDLDWDRIFPIP